MLKKIVYLTLILPITLLSLDGLEFVLVNNTCRQMEIMCASENKTSKFLRLFPFTQSNFVVEEDKPFFIQWRRIYGSLKGVRIGKIEMGDLFKISVNPPFRSEGIFEILDDEGHYRQLLTITDKNTTQQVSPKKG